MSLDRINPAELSPATGFSHAVVATGSRLVFLAGQTALDGAGKVVGRPCRSSSRRPWPTCCPRWPRRAARRRTWPG